MGLALAVGCVQQGQLPPPDEAPDDANQATSPSVSWCDVAPILEEKCQRCHRDPPDNGAPFPLLTYADTQESDPARDDPERKRFEVMLLAVGEDLMPPVSLLVEPSVVDLTCEERTTLLTWLAAEAPASDDDPDCEGAAGRLLECTGDD